MGDKSKTILVTGATGQQGGAVARHLLVNGWSVRALTRDASSEKAQALLKAGADVIQGNLDDYDSLVAALKGVYGVFSVQAFWDIGVEGEERQGKALADAAKAANVQHLVYSSVGGADRNSGVPHFESKWHIEERIRALNLPATILRPVEFMENLFYTRQPIVEQGVLVAAKLTEKPHQWIAVEDIGWFVAYVFDHPEQYIGQAIELAGDSLTQTELANTLSRVIGRPVHYIEQTLDEVRQSPYGGEELAVMIEWFNEEGYDGDIDALRLIHPNLLTLHDWLQRTGWANTETAASHENAN